MSLFIFFIFFFSFVFKKIQKTKTLTGMGALLEKKLCNFHFCLPVIGWNLLLLEHFFPFKIRPHFGSATLSEVIKVVPLCKMGENRILPI